MITRHALIVGGGSGIGLALALNLLDGGWYVSVVSRRGRAPEVEHAGGRVMAADCTDPVQASRVVADSQPVDALVVAAGPFRRTPLVEETPAGWRETFVQNLDIVFHLAREALPPMCERGWGRILTFAVARAARLQGVPGLTAWYVAKAGVVALTRALAIEGAPHGVTANCISPGWIRTERSDDAELARAASRVPAGRPGRLDEAVAVARFLLSDHAGYVNGADVPVSGAWGV